MTEQQQLLVAQVLTLAAALETKSLVEGKKVATDWPREAARLVGQHGPRVLELLAQSRHSPG